LILCAIGEKWFAKTNRKAQDTNSTATRCQEVAKLVKTHQDAQGK